MQCFLFQTCTKPIVEPIKKIDYQGHRGCRGLMPENTIPAFEKALDYVTTLELDVVVSKDKKIIVSHEPWMSEIYCSLPSGEPITKSEAKEIKIYKLDYDQIKEFDCGKRGNPKFPEQQKIAVSKPSLKDMVEYIDNYCLENKKELPWYDIEIKSEEAHYGDMQPQPEEYVRLMLEELYDLNIKDRCNLQSFDIKILEAIKAQDSEVIIAYLIDNIQGLNKNLKKLSFKPEIYSPYYKFVTKSMVKKCHSKGIKVIPWTVNDQKAMRKLIEFGVDGIITDYPNLKID